MTLVNPAPRGGPTEKTGVFDARCGVWYSKISKAAINLILFAKEGRGIPPLRSLADENSKN